jgi:hypothetical protein
MQHAGRGGLPIVIKEEATLNEVTLLYRAGGFFRIVA